MNLTETSPQQSHRRYFFDKFGITERLLERCLGEALSAGGDYADLYFESVTSTSLGVDAGGAMSFMGPNGVSTLAVSGGGSVTFSNSSALTIGLADSAKVLVI